MWRFATLGQIEKAYDFLKMARFLHYIVCEKESGWVKAIWTGKIPYNNNDDRSRPLSCNDMDDLPNLDNRVR